MKTNTLITGNALTILQKLPNNSVHVGVTSPPYNKQENKKGWLVKNVKYDIASDKKTESSYQKEQIAVLNELYRITKSGGHFFYNHKIRWEKGLLIHPVEWLLKTEWVLRQEIIWDRGIAANIRGWRFWQTDERIYWLYKPKQKNNKIGKELLSRHALVTSIWKMRPENNNPHPAPFPLPLPTRCIYSVLDEQPGMVIDPYCGSGTTLVAAQLLGHRFIGIDISPDYISMARTRLEHSENEKYLVNEEIARHIVLKTFKQRKDEGMYVGHFKKNLDALHLF